MKFKHQGIKQIALAAVLLTGILSGCGTVSSKEKLMKNDEIITYEAPQEGKEIVRIGFSMAMDWEPLINGLNEKFPTKQFIYDFGSTSGINLSLDTVGDIVKNNDYDFVVANYWNAPYLGADISDQSFLSNFQTASLDSIKSNGRIYGIPLPISAMGVYYNKPLFEENGWTYPTSVDEFITLADKIKAKGITPFDSCFKYEGQLTRVLEGLLYDELFTKPEGMAWYEKLVEGKATFAEYAQPMFEAVKKLSDAGVFSESSFSASLTTMRNNFFAGKLAMIDYSSDIYSLAASEGCNFDIALGGYPSTTGEASPIIYASSAVLYIPSGIKNDAKRFAFDASVMDYLSTSEGQDALLTGWTGVPSVKNYTGSNALYGLVQPFIQSGAYHSDLDFAPSQAMIKPLKSLIKNAALEIVKGASVKDAINELDTAYKDTLNAGVSEPTYSKIAEATDDFTILETSYYMADKIKEATAADIALVPSGGFYRSNMGYLKKGDITDDMRLFYEKGVGAKDYITSYKLTGAQLKELLEKPIINGAEKDQFIAPSGLKLTYAPWHSRGNRIVDIAFEDGTAIDETKLYNVAAYAKVIDNSYISETIQSYPELADPQSFMLASFKADQTISPNTANRLKLSWDIPA
jgi:raffinose/stachyose/melibiose transport system substrate-binding protein